MTLVIKVYRENPEFTDGGKFTQHLEKNVNVGDIVMCEGPFGLIKYEGNGNFLFKKAPLKQKKRIVLIAGGTGVTPLYNIAANSIHAKEGL